MIFISFRVLYAPRKKVFHVFISHMCARYTAIRMTYVNLYKYYRYHFYYSNILIKMQKLFNRINDRVFFFCITNVLYCIDVQNILYIERKICDVFLLKESTIVISHITSLATLMRFNVVRTALLNLQPSGRKVNGLVFLTC